MDVKQAGFQPDEYVASVGRLRRDLGVVDAVGIGLGAIIGGGIFIVTGVAAGIAGPALVAGLVIAGIAAACNALSSAELAARFPESGGTYEYGYRVLTPWTGFTAGWMFLVSKLAAAGAVALGFAQYTAHWFPASTPPRAIAVAAIVLLTIANLFGIKKAGRLNVAVVAVTCFALVVFILLGLPRMQFSHFTPFAPHGLRGALESAGLLFFAYTGYARLATLGEEVSEPRWTIPRAIIISLSIAAVLYLGTAVVAIGTLGSAGMAASPSPIVDAAKTFPEKWVPHLVGVGAATAMLGVMLSQILGVSRMMFAMARRSDLPGALSRTGARHNVPHFAVVLCGAIVVGVVLLGGLEWIVATAAFAILLYYGIANWAAMRLPRAERLYPSWVPVIGLVSCVVLAFSLKPITIATALALLIVGLGVRLLCRRISATSPIS